MTIDIDMFTYARFTKWCKEWGFVDQYGLPESDKVVNFFLDQQVTADDINKMEKHLGEENYGKEET